MISSTIKTMAVAAISCNYLSSVSAMMVDSIGFGSGRSAPARRRTGNRKTTSSHKTAALVAAKQPPVAATETPVEDLGWRCEVDAEGLFRMKPPVRQVGDRISVMKHMPCPSGAAAVIKRIPGTVVETKKGRFKVQSNCGERVSTWIDESDRIIGPYSFSQWYKAMKSLRWKIKLGEWKLKSETKHKSWKSKAKAVIKRILGVGRPIDTFKSYLGKLIKTNWHFTDFLPTKSADRNPQRKTLFKKMLDYCSNLPVDPVEPSAAQVAVVGADGAGEEKESAEKADQMFALPIGQQLIDQLLSELEHPEHQLTHSKMMWIWAKRFFWTAAFATGIGAGVIASGVTFGAAPAAAMFFGGIGIGISSIVASCPYQALD